MTAQERETTTSVGIAGRWEGRLGASGLRLILDVTRTTDSLYFGTLTSVDQGDDRIPIDRITVNGDSMQFEIRSVRVTYNGALSPDRSQLVGIWTQGGRARLVLTRTNVPPVAGPRPNAYSLFGVPIALSVPVPPMLFAGLGKQHLAYEIHLTNHSGVDLLLTRLEIFADTTTLARWEGAELHAIVSQRRPNVTDNREIPAGGWAIGFVWVTLDSGAPAPAFLRHRLTVGSQRIEGAIPMVATDPIVIGPPLRGEGWMAANGPGNTGGGHRRALVPIEGNSFIAQRFAIDWARIGPNGRLYEGEPTVNASYFGYGADVIAVADGIVDSVKDGIPENVPGRPRLRAAESGDTLRAVPMTLETVSGNYVLLNLNGGRYAFYSHLMPGSLRVKPGDRVRRGEVIARLGNSGNSTGPHLHFQITDRSHALASEGLPYLIDSWELLRATDVWERRTNEMPMLDARVRFSRD